MNSILGDYNVFLKYVLSKLQEKGIDINAKMIDHIAYRCISEENYENMKKELDKVAVKVFERNFNNRNVSIYRFSNPLEYDGFRIPNLELMSYRAGDTSKEGLEHIEIIVTDPLQLIHEYPSIEWTIVPDRTINKEVFMRLENYAVKFHNLPIEEAVAKQIETGQQ